MFLEDGCIEYHASYRNEHGTGYDTIVSNPMDGRVDILIYQIVCHEVPEEPSVSLSLPPEAAAVLLQTINGGLGVAVHIARMKKYH